MFAFRPIHIERKSDRSAAVSRKKILAAESVKVGMMRLGQIGETFPMLPSDNVARQQKTVSQHRAQPVAETTFRHLP